MAIVDSPVVADVVTSLKTNPVILGFLVLNGMFLALLWWTMNSQTEAAHTELQTLMGRCFDYIAKVP